MSLANPKKVHITAWLSCPDFWLGNPHGEHIYEHKGKSVVCAGSDGTRYRVNIGVTEFEHAGQTYALTGLTNEDLSLLLNAVYALNHHMESVEIHNKCMDMINRLYIANPE